MAPRPTDDDRDLRVLPTYEVARIQPGRGRASFRRKLRIAPVVIRRPPSGDAARRRRFGCCSDSSSGVRRYKPHRARAGAPSPRRLRKPHRTMFSVEHSCYRYARDAPSVPSSLSSASIRPTARLSGGRCRGCTLSLRPALHPGHSGMAVFGLVLVAMASCQSFVNCGPGLSDNVVIALSIALGFFNLACATILWRRSAKLGRPRANTGPQFSRSQDGV